MVTWLYFSIAVTWLFILWSAGFWTFVKKDSPRKGRELMEHAGDLAFTAWYVTCEHQLYGSKGRSLCFVLIPSLAISTTSNPREFCLGLQFSLSLIRLLRTTGFFFSIQSHFNLFSILYFDYYHLYFSQSQILFKSTLKVIFFLNSNCVPLLPCFLQEN